MTRDFKGIWIPKEIWLDTNLNWTEKLLLVEIDSLSSLEEGCFAGNDYFSKFFGLSKDRISKLVSSLKNKGYIEVELIYKPNSKQIDKRIISTFGYRQKQLEGIGKNNHRGIGKNAEDNNTSFNNTKDYIYPAEEKEVPSSEGINQSLDEDKVKFRENIKRYMKLIADVTGKTEFELSTVINPQMMKNYDMNKLIEEIESSDFLKGKLKRKPVISNFTRPTMINRIMLGEYRNAVEENKTKVSIAGMV